MKIKAINIDGVTKEEQISKFVEEVEEFITAVLINDIENIKEEYCDLITAGAGVLLKCNIDDMQLEEYFNSKHIDKLKERNFKPRIKNGGNENGKS